MLAVLLNAIYSKYIMTPNDVLKRIRYALNLNDPTMLEIFKQGGHAVDLAGLKNLSKRRTKQDMRPAR
jgi:uncharacterized protein YehS (DUF1456 family)